MGHLLANAKINLFFLVLRVNFAKLFTNKQTLSAKCIVSQPPNAVTLPVRRAPAGIPRGVTNVAVLRGMLGKTAIEVSMNSRIPNSQQAFPFFFLFI